MFAFVIIFIIIISGSLWHKTDEYNCGAGDGGRVCLLAGGPLDCSQSSIFPLNRRDQAHFGFKGTGFSKYSKENWYRRVLKKYLKLFSGQLVGPSLVLFRVKCYSLKQGK